MDWKGYIAGVLVGMLIIAILRITGVLPPL